MAYTDIRRLSHVQEVLTQINKARNKYGLSSISQVESVGGITMSSEVARLQQAIAQAKSASGSPANITGIKDYSKGDLITGTLMDLMYNKAVEIYNYCACDCNRCSCDCNYCSCNCDRCSCVSYCSCDCDYCSCDCDRCVCVSQCSCNCDRCSCVSECSSQCYCNCNRCSCHRDTCVCYGDMGCHESPGW